MEGSKTQLSLGNYLIDDKKNKISFFRHGYKNYQNFVRDTRYITLNNTLSFGSTGSIDLHKQGHLGDLITNITLEVELPSLELTSLSGKGVGYCNGIGNALIETMDLKIGGNLIDRHSSIWMDIKRELFTKPGTLAIHNDTLKKYADEDYNWDTFRTGGKIHIPLQFWFCNYGSGQNNTFVLPITSINNQTIELTFKIRGINDLISVQDDGSGTLTASSYSIANASLLVDYITLEKEDRIELQSQKLQNYLITQVQELAFGIEASATKLTVNVKELRYPVNELIWVIRRNDAATTNEYFKYGDSLGDDTNNPITKVHIKFENRDRLPELNAEHFTHIEPLKVHNQYPKGRHIHCYSFAIDPENFAQPSGVCNFSGLHNMQMVFTLRSGLGASTLYLFGVNYNVLKVSQGGAQAGSAWLLHTLSKSTPTVLDKTNREVCS